LSRDRQDLDLQKCKSGSNCATPRELVQSRRSLLLSVSAKGGAMSQNVSQNSEHDRRICRRDRAYVKLIKTRQLGRQLLALPLSHRVVSSTDPPPAPISGITSVMIKQSRTDDISPQFSSRTSFVLSPVSPLRPPTASSAPRPTSAKSRLVHLNVVVPSASTRMQRSESEPSTVSRCESPAAQPLDTAGTGSVTIATVPERNPEGPLDIALRRMHSARPAR